MDKAATFTFWKGDKTVRYVNGIVTGFGLGKSGFVRTSYQMVVEPALVRAELQSDSRIFQHQNSEKIIRTLLQKNRVDNVAFEPLPSDWEREYCVQYRETDLTFIECLATDEQGRPFSRYRLESALALSETAQATGDDMRVILGCGFTLAFNQDWLVVQVEHQGYQTGVMEEEAGEEGNRYENKLFLISPS
ncbi:contractile injection system protein, VgrG/Pvc8 family [Rodentibacter caecimuris]|uniref:contractile injection system protein, VgrG/Pvc8 family n=1 Tax=Rodentibacter caecimuris TaxID=1796644 RepID=UPI00214F8561|nr:MULTISPECIES: contractile injection system protein, VgrG/Pvc8 family [Pasteurellaceae]MCR1836485.1 contractile injection system protein, VgrG/Pvc8 family [Pasteurella caecimuris]MCU0106595.1 contractile injection system protein, VgrG/Pvc8 family [Pasteurella caecimuris]